MNKPLIFTLIGTVLLVGAGVVAYSKTGGGASGNGAYDTFAQCLTDSGATFYGAFWCPHCQNQKRAFGSSVKLLPYVECSTPDGRGQTQVCTDAGITGYPTWEFSSGERVSGEVAMETLAEKSGCELPVAQ